MNTSSSDSREELRAVLRQFLADRSSESEVRRAMATDEGYDPTVWKTMAEQLGLAGIAIPDEYGGSGSGLAEVGVVLEEMGSSLLCAPYFSTVVLGANALLLANDTAAAKAWLPSIAAGELTATVALPHRSLRDPQSGTITATRLDGVWTLDGQARWVVDGATAGLVLVFAQTSDGLSLFGITADARGLQRSNAQTIDETRRLSTISCVGTPAQLVGEPGAGAAVAERLLQAAAAALSCEQVGGAQRALDMAVSYVKVREQFGRPIGSFQAIKHRCADLLLEVESARSAAYRAVASIDEQADDIAAIASLAKAFCSDTYRHVTAENIQLHGGIGFTWEHPAHLYYKRAAVSAALFGEPTEHRELFVRSLGL